MGMSGDFNIEKPDGYIYYETNDGTRLSVAGIQHRKQSFMTAFSGKKDLYFSLEAEPNSSYDKNAVKVMAGNCHIGYIDKETAKLIASDNILKDLLFYPKKFKVTDSGDIYLDYSLLKPGKKFKGEQRVETLGVSIDLPTMAGKRTGCMALLVITSIPAFIIYLFL